MTAHGWSTLDATGRVEMTPPRGVRPGAPVYCVVLLKVFAGGCTRYRILGRYRAEGTARAWWRGLHTSIRWAMRLGWMRPTAYFHYELALVRADPRG